MVKSTETPMQVRFWFDSHIDFSSFTINPEEFREFLSNKESCFVFSRSLSVPKPPSMKIAIFIKFSLQCFIRARMIFVNIKGAEESLNSKTVKIKYLFLPSRFQEKPKNFW